MALRLTFALSLLVVLVLDQRLSVVDGAKPPAPPIISEPPEGPDTSESSEADTTDGTDPPPPPPGSPAEPHPDQDSVDSQKSDDDEDTNTDTSDTQEDTANKDDTNEAQGNPGEGQSSPIESVEEDEDDNAQEEDEDDNAQEEDEDDNAQEEDTKDESETARNPAQGPAPAAPPPPPNPPGETAGPPPPPILQDYQQGESQDQGLSPAKVDNQFLPLSQQLNKLEKRVEDHIAYQLETNTVLQEMIQNNALNAERLTARLDTLAQARNETSQNDGEEDVYVLMESWTHFKTSQEAVNGEFRQKLEYQKELNVEIQAHIREQGQSIEELQVNERNQRRPKDCHDLWLSGIKKSGVYTVYLFGNGSLPLDVYCDMDTAGGGWLVFQKRINGSENFYRNWEEYANGFGNLEHEFWLGNHHIADLTRDKQHTLRVDMEEFDGTVKFIEYSSFLMFPEKNQFRIQVKDDYFGNAGNSIVGMHNGPPFSTYDRDNDYYSNSNCAQTYIGAWWYNMCHMSNLNGLYSQNGTCEFGKGINWFSMTGYERSLRSTEMKIRPT